MNIQKHCSVLFSNFEVDWDWKCTFSWSEAPLGMFPVEDMPAISLEVEFEAAARDPAVGLVVLETPGFCAGTIGAITGLGTVGGTTGVGSENLNTNFESDMKTWYNFKLGNIII